VSVAITRTASVAAFAYTPPAIIANVVRVLVTTSPGVNVEILRVVLRGIWRLTPHTRVLVTPTEGLTPWMLGGNMTEVDLDLLPLRLYPGRIAGLPSVSASHLLYDCDGCIHVSAARPDALDAPPTLAGLRALCVGLDAVEDAEALKAAYFAIGNCYVGAVVDAGDQVTWSDDLLDADATAHRLLNAEPPSLLAEIRRLRKALKAGAPQ
jgi:hypothetical protein